MIYIILVIDSMGVFKNNLFNKWVQNQEKSQFKGLEETKWCLSIGISNTEWQRSREGHKKLRQINGNILMSKPDF